MPERISFGITRFQVGPCRQEKDNEGDDKLAREKSSRRFACGRDRRARNREPARYCFISHSHVRFSSNMTGAAARFHGFGTEPELFGINNRIAGTTRGFLRHRGRNTVMKRHGRNRFGPAMAAFLPGKRGFLPNPRNGVHFFRSSYSVGMCPIRRIRPARVCLKKVRARSG